MSGESFKVLQINFMIIVSPKKQLFSQKRPILGQFGLVWLYLENIIPQFLKSVPFKYLMLYHSELLAPWTSSWCGQTSLRFFLYLCYLQGNCAFIYLILSFIYNKMNNILLNYLTTKWERDATTTLDLIC